MAAFMTSSPAESREAGRLPDFLLIGAAKAGTTALFTALARHPHVCASQTKRAAAGWRPSHLYQRRGFYGQQLTRWLGHFPREQLLILFYGDWCERPTELLALAWRHIGLQPLTDPVVERENVSSRQPHWKWLHQLMVGDNRLRRQRWLPLGAERQSLGRSFALTSDPGLRSILPCGPGSQSPTSTTSGRSRA